MGSEQMWLMLDKWQMLDFPKIKLIRDDRAYTYYNKNETETMQFFVDPPQYLGWEVCPPEKIPYDIDFWERFDRKRTSLWYTIIQSTVMYFVSQVCLLLGCCSCCHACVTSCCYGTTQKLEEGSAEQVKKDS